MWNCVSVLIYLCVYILIYVCVGNEFGFTIYGPSFDNTNPVLIQTSVNLKSRSNQKLFNKIVKSKNNYEEVSNGDPDVCRFASAACSSHKCSEV